MSPFAVALRRLRFERGLRQQELADLIHCERTFLSSLENDLKLAPAPAFVDQLGDVLVLDRETLDGLHEARARSRRKYIVSPLAAAETFELFYDLFERQERLSEAQIRGFRVILDMGDQNQTPVVPHEMRIRRRDRQPRSEEGAM